MSPRAFHSASVSGFFTTFPTLLFKLDCTTFSNILSSSFCSLSASTLFSPAVVNACVLFVGIFTYPFAIVPVKIRSTGLNAVCTCAQKVLGL